MDKLHVFSIPVNIGTYKEFIGKIVDIAQQQKSYYTCVANVHMLVEAYFNKDFANHIKNAHVITPDGLPLTWAIRMFYGIRQERVAGMDLLPDLLEQAEARGVPVYFYGGNGHTLERTRRYLNSRYAGLQVAGLYSPPFRKLSAQEDEEAINRINASGAQIVFVSLGCPKQERWMAAMSSQIHAVMIGVGGALSVMVGEHKRAPKWLQRAGLEWVYRLMQEPGRLFKRYAVTNSIFMYLFVKSYLNSRVLHKTNTVNDFYP